METEYKPKEICDELLEALGKIGDLEIRLRGMGQIRRHFNVTGILVRLEELECEIEREINRHVFNQVKKAAVKEGILLDGDGEE